MEEVFVPDLATGWRWFSFAAVVAVGALVWSWRAYGGRGGRLRQVGQTVGPLLALCGVAGVAAAAYDIAGSPVIAVAPDYLILGRDTVASVDVRRAYLEPVAVGGGYGAPSAATEELAVIEFADGSTLLLSEGNYDTRAVVEAVNAALGR